MLKTDFDNVIEYDVYMNLTLKKSRFIIIWLYKFIIATWMLMTNEYF